MFLNTITLWFCQWENSVRSAVAWLLPTVDAGSPSAGVSLLDHRMLGLFTRTRALVTFDMEKAGVQAVIKAVEAASSPLSAYKARVFETR